MSFNTEKEIHLVSAGDALVGRETPILSTSTMHAVNGRRLDCDYPAGAESILFGMGCFWGAEKCFWSLPGVWITAVGYCGGFTPNPTYEEVCSGQTAHNEAVLVVYQAGKIKIESLLKTFWENHNPTQGMRQGNDIGSQYRSAIYYSTEEQRRQALHSKERYSSCLSQKGFAAVTTEILPTNEFYFAEDWHQQYLQKNPSGYCGLGGTGVVLTGT